MKRTSQYESSSGMLFDTMRVFEMNKVKCASKKPREGEREVEW